MKKKPCIVLHVSGEPADAPHPYRGTVVALGTRHGKEEQLGPPFAAVLGARLCTPPDLDTDRFGAFTGEVPRTTTPREAARGKARLAMRAAGLPRGLATEASYGPLAGVGLPGHEELVLFVDDALGVEVAEVHRSLGLPGGTLRVRGPGPDVDRYFASVGWPAQAVVVRAGPGLPVAKGVTERGRLDEAIRAAARAAPDGHAVLEPDLRAHRCPGRRVVLAELAGRLARRLATCCPACGTPGWGRVGVEPGLPCRACGVPTANARADRYGCPRCPHRVLTVRPEASADPRWCPVCNP